jgi:cobalt-zinc-cadmium efflux system membrane fusion protein
MQIKHTLAIALTAVTITGATAWVVLGRSPASAPTAEPAASAPQDDPATHVDIDAEKIGRANIAIAAAGPATLHARLSLYGRLAANEDRLVVVQPRFPGIVKSLRKRLGDSVEKDEVIATIESNQSLTGYDIRSPIAGTVIEKTGSVGSHAGDGTRIYVVADLKTVWVDFSVYRQDFARIRVGQPVAIALGDGARPVESRIAYVSPLGAPDTQTMLARAVVDNEDGTLRPGLFVTGEVMLDDVPVPLAVESSAIQSLDGRQTVFAQDEKGFEARPVTTGRRDGAMTEILAGLKPGERYAAGNSFVVKAELGKSSAEEE